MGRQRDPKRDEAFEIYKAANGEINLNVIATQLCVSDGTLRGWKAKDKWEDLLTGEVVETERPDNNMERNATVRVDEEDGGRDELFLNAVQIVIESQQASVSLLQRRLRIGYTRAARLIDLMEQSKYVGPCQGDKPREVLIKELSPVFLMLLNEKGNKSERNERNALKKQTERSINTERSKKIEDAPKIVEEPEEEEPEEPDDDGLTPKQRMFVKYYLINFNATQAAIKAGYSPKTAKEIGYELLTKPHIKTSVKKYTEEMTAEIGINVQRIITEYMKVAFADITEFVEFGQKDEIIMTDEGPVLDPISGDTMTYKRSFVAFKNSDEVDGTLINEVKQGKDGISVKLHDKMKALDVLNKYMDLLPDHHKRMVAEEKLKLDKERLELDKAKAAGEGDLDEELIDDWVSGVMEDETDGEHEQADAGIQEEDTCISEKS